jgi:hypothetical protein
MAKNRKARYALLLLALVGPIITQAVAEPAQDTARRAIAAADGFGWDRSVRAPR